MYCVGACDQLKYYIPSAECCDQSVQTGVPGSLMCDKYSTPCLFLIINTPYTILFCLVFYTPYSVTKLISLKFDSIKSNHLTQEDKMYKLEGKEMGAYAILENVQVKIESR